MIEKAASRYNIDLKDSWMIGDKNSDIELAENAGVGNSIYIGSRKHRRATLSFPSVKECKHYFLTRSEKRVTDE